MNRHYRNSTTIPVDDAPRAAALRLPASLLIFLGITFSACTPNESETATSASLAPHDGPARAVVTRDAAVPNTPRRREPVQTAPAASPDQTSAVPRASAAQRVARLAQDITDDLAKRCPLSDAADQAAYEACRKAMYDGSKLRAALPPFTLWGRQHKNADALLKDTTLTQFGPDVLTGMYLPLFMFTGKHAVAWNASEKLYRVELGARFRNRLQPGQFPYPFWHEDEKWKTYEDANAIILWVEPKQLKVKVAQFTRQGALEPAAPNAPVATPAFDGKWMWTDAEGRSQPKVTLFDGLFRADNPYLKSLDASYRELALSLREGQCMACHVPNNPNKMKRLVLLQTPAHAAAEIKRVMATVNRGRMPVNEISGVEEPLTGALKGTLLKRAEKFETVVDAAKAWEAAQALKAGAGPSGAQTPRAARTATPTQTE